MGQARVLQIATIDAARIMRECVAAAIAADVIKRWVAGSLGPTNTTPSLSPSGPDAGYRAATFDSANDVYR